MYLPHNGTISFDSVFLMRRWGTSTVVWATQKRVIWDPPLTGTYLEKVTSGDRALEYFKPRWFYHEWVKVFFWGVQRELSHSAEKQQCDF